MQTSTSHTQIKNEEIRIVSLLPSASEIAVGLGLRDQLVGRSHECNHPPGLETLPALTAPKFQSDGTSRGIDEAVLNLVRDGLSVYSVDTQKLEELKPNYILTQSHCDLCAVSVKDVEIAVSEIIGSKPQIINLEPMGYDMIFEDFFTIGNAVGRQNEAESLVKRVQGGIEKIAQTSDALVKKKRVAVIEWLDPLMNAGNWIPTLVEKAGGINCLGKAEEHSHYTSFDEIVASQPDIVLITPCGFNIEKSMEELDRLKQHVDWKDFIDHNKIYVCDGDLFFNRPGPRILETVEIIAEILYPNIFHFGHQETGWHPL